MTTQNIALFKAIGEKMDYLNLRQRVIAQNVANADTPKYKPQDLKEVDFSKVLDKVSQKNGVPNVGVATTKSGHIGMGGDVETARARKQKETYEVAPTGNAVIMEEQLLKAGETVADYTLMSNLYQKQIGMLRTALGQGR